MTPKTKERKTYSVRLSEDAIELIKEVDQEQGVGSQAETLEWLIRTAGGDLKVGEMLRKAWVHSLSRDHGVDAPVSVLISGGEPGSDGRTIYTAKATVNGEEVPTLTADAGEMERGDLEIILRNPENDQFPFLVFDRYTATEVSALLEETGWEGSRDLITGVTRKVRELLTLPFLDAPGDRTPDDHGEPIKGDR